MPSPASVFHVKRDVSGRDVGTANCSVGQLGAERASCTGLRVRPGRFTSADYGSPRRN